MSRLWEKGEPVDDLVLRFTVGRDHLLDARLVAYDVRASSAHAEMLRDAGWLDPAECESLVHELTSLADEHARGEWSIALEEEDVHTALESRLVGRLGETGGKIHLGRSRNDQVLAALRLYLKDAVAELSSLGERVVASLDAVIEKDGDVPLPGYTHMQRAMPSSVRSWAGGFRAEIVDDLEGLAGTLRRIDRNPLGSAAGYGAPLRGLDREHTRARLGFASVHEPVTAVQLSRGKAEAHVLFELALLQNDLGRLAADLCLFATSEFGFVRLDEAFTTGSSIMPQKRNPDVFELVRGQAAMAKGRLDQVMGVTSRLTSGYHRDLQLVKEPLFDGIDAARAVLEIMARALRVTRFDREAASAAMGEDLLAAERAYRLVAEEGIGFREAYRRVARGERGGDRSVSDGA